jgi:2-polyprenyl-6-methoxyphenol hydroxylase-like FAD-dependent oxidoreductase
VSEGRRVLVVGGGIAGLAAARAMLARGFEPDVVERDQSWPRPGAGVYLPANAVRALGALGLHDRFVDRACLITRQRFLDHRDRVLLEVDLAAVWAATGPCAAISHSGLHELLRAGVPVRTGTTVTALVEQGPRVHATFDDGSTGDYDLVVGADGIHSWVRAVVFSGQPPRSLALASWRFLVDDAGDVSSWTVRLGHGRTFLTVPLGHGRTYCYADVDAPSGLDPTGGDPAGLYDEFAEPVPTLMQALTTIKDSVHFSPIQEVVQVPWVSGRVVLVGDAAHAMSPNMAEGVGMALEDALVLAETLVADRPLQDYEARRRPRVAFVQTQTHRRDRTRNLPAVVRDTSLRLAGRRIFRSNYRALVSEP